MSISLSNRLQACCQLVHPGDCIADIGCDHGYLGIYLLKEGLAASVIAADVNEGPLNSAVINAEKFGVRDKMSFFLSDGVRNIPREFDTLVCAGMGADTMIHILDSAPWLQSEKYRIILQCQSKRPALRKYLYENGYQITFETLAQDGKFLYPIMEVIYKPTSPLTPAQYHISPALQNSGSPLLSAFYQRIIDGLQQTVDGLKRAGDVEKYQEFEDIIKTLQEEQP